jgi:hypothetical protein
MEYKINELYPEWWAWWVQYEAEQQSKYFEALIRNCTQEGKNPLYIVRYEDLC